jgi:hypothetical protein
MIGASGIRRAKIGKYDLAGFQSLNLPPFKTKFWPYSTPSLSGFIFL